MDYIINNTLNELNRSEDDEQLINILIEYINNQENQINSLQEEVNNLSDELDEKCYNCDLKVLCEEIADEDFKCSKSNRKYINSNKIKEELQRILLYGDY